MGGGVLGQNPGPGGGRQGDAPAFAPADESVEHILGIAREHDLPVGLEQRVETVPDVGNDGRAAGGRLEETHAGAEARLDHVGAGRSNGPLDQNEIQGARGLNERSGSDAGG